MLPGIEMMGCTGLAVPAEVMHHVVKVESSYNPYAIGVVGGNLVRQPRSLPEAVATVRMLAERGYNFSLGLAQVNRYNLSKYGLDSYEKAFEKCANLQAGSRILAECNSRAKGDWGKAFSCYYSGNFTTGFRHGYVQKVVASWRAQAGAGSGVQPIPVVDRRAVRRDASPARVVPMIDNLLQRRIQPSSLSPASQERTSMVAPAVLHSQPVSQQPTAVPASGAIAASSAPVMLALPEAPVPVQRVGAPVVNPVNGTVGQPQPAGTRMDDAFVF